MNGSSIMHITASMEYRRQYGLAGGSVVSFFLYPFSANEQNELDEIATPLGVL